MPPAWDLGFAVGYFYFVWVLFRGFFLKLVSILKTNLTRSSMFNYQWNHARSITSLIVKRFCHYLVHIFVIVYCSSTGVFSGKTNA